MPKKKPYHVPREVDPLISLQIEYSLLERTVEGELIPMAQDVGLGVTPWGPLKSGSVNEMVRRLIFEES
jgi:aryl-alcohol dehydrogenase-like predicted oxidoreductase